MAIKKSFGDNVAEQSATLGTGTYILISAISGYMTFASQYSTGDTPYYAVRNYNETKFEYNRGATLFTASDPPTLTRNVWLSSEANGPVDWQTTDLPLIVYVPTPGEVLEAITSGWLSTTRSPVLKFGLWWDQDNPSTDIHTLMAFDGVSDIPIAQINGATHAIVPLYVPIAGGTMTGQLNSTTSLTGANTPALNIQQTWNNAATPFYAFMMDVTDTASSVSSYLAVWRVGGANRFLVSKTGTVTSLGSYVAGSGSQYNWSTRSSFWSPADSQIRMTNNAGTDFNRLMWGGTTSAFPAIKKLAGPGLGFRNADDTADVDITAKAATLTGALIGTSISLDSTLSGVGPVPIAIQQGWNSAATAFTGFDLNIVHTASHASSNLATWRFNGTPYVTFTKGGAITLIGVLTTAAVVSTGAISAGVGSVMGWSTSTYMNAPSNGKLQITNAALNAGVTLDVITDGTLKVRNRADNADGNLTAGTATFSGNVSVPTASPGDNDTSAASTAFVTAAISAAGSGSIIPAGVIVDFGGTAAPTGWLLCQGQAVSRTTYSALYAALGSGTSPWGQGDGSTTFNVPDLGGRVTAGKEATASRLTAAGSGITGSTLASAGGGETHSLTEAQLAAHAHSHNAPTHNHGHNAVGHPHYSDIGAGTTFVTANSGQGVWYVFAAGTYQTYYSGITNYVSDGSYNDAAGIGLTISNTGSGTAHQNTQPTIIVNKIIKT